MALGGLTGALATITVSILWEYCDILFLWYTVGCGCCCFLAGSVTSQTFPCFLCSLACVPRFSLILVFTGGGRLREGLLISEAYRSPRMSWWPHSPEELWVVLNRINPACLADSKYCVIGSSFAWSQFPNAGICPLLLHSSILVDFGSVTQEAKEKERNKKSIKGREKDKSLKRENKRVKNKGVLGSSSLKKTPQRHESCRFYLRIE